MIVFDLDDTLANTSHRQHLIAEGSSSWDEFYLAGARDAPMVSLHNLRQFALMGANVMIWTGRGNIARQVTIDWLYAHGVSVLNEPPSEGVTSVYPEIAEIRGLFMRPDGDFTKGWLLKEKWLLQFNEFFPGDKVHMAFDDDPKAITMFVLNNVPAYRIVGGARDDEE